MVFGQLLKIQKGQRENDWDIEICEGCEELREVELSYVCLQFPALRLILFLKSFCEGGVPVYLRFSFWKSESIELAVARHQPQYYNNLHSGVRWSTNTRETITESLQKEQLTVKNRSYDDSCRNICKAYKTQWLGFQASQRPCYLCRLTFNW